MDATRIRKLVEKTKNLKVLYVEDNKETREQSLKMFDNFFNHIDVASNGLEGLSLYSEKDSDFYQLIISDMNMPVMNGYDMSIDILKQNKNQSIIMITAYNDKDHSEKFIQAGIKNYIHKPIQLETLVNSLEKVVFKS